MNLSEPYQRPDPDQLLAQVQAEEQAKQRGKLKIFLGYAAGVGKTYAMLGAARQRQEAGVDVVVACVETHQRAETEALLVGLELLPRRTIHYRGVMLTEMDIDGVLARRPQLVLVDELAHTNAPDSRHPKRYQDVEELLDAGIDVYTTLNIQHLESFNDVVAQITGVIVRETVPDRLLDQATEIELIDLPPDELLARLREGKVYVPAQASQAIQNFFRKGNLTALRGISMRRAADRIDEQMRAYMQAKAIPGPWPASERLLVSVSPSPLSERLVRTARRLADELNVPWWAVYVETPAQTRLSSNQKEQVNRHLKLAEELGATTTVLYGTSIVPTLINYARSHNITKIIAGKPLYSRWQELWRGSIVDNLIRQSGNIDIYVVTSQTDSTPPFIESQKWQLHSPWSHYMQSIGLVALATALSFPLRAVIAPTNLAMIYLAVVIVAALYLGRGPAIITSVLGVLAFDFFLIHPYLTFAVSDTQYILTFAALLIVGLVISNLAARFREQAEAVGQRVNETTILYALGRDLAVAGGLEDVIQVIISNVSQAFGRRAVIFLPETEETLRLAGHSPDFVLDDNEQAIATWSFRYAQPTGRGTDTLPAAVARYVPLKTANGVVGVLGVKPADPQREMTPDQRRLLDTFANLCALAVEREQLSEGAQQAQLLREKEKLQTALLNSISHDLRTPLASITGALSSLQDDAGILDEQARQELLSTAWEEADRLNRLVSNLLEMTRLQAGAMQVIREWVDIQEIVGVALGQLTNRLQNRLIQLHIPNGLPALSADLVLVAQAVVNLLDNALKYAPADQPIELEAFCAGKDLILEVADRGPGVPEEELERIFEKFYRAFRGNTGGTGLGLSISKGIIEAHGGRIWARNRLGGGLIISIAFPIETES